MSGTDRIRFDFLAPTHRVSIISPLPRERSLDSRFIDDLAYLLPNDLFNSISVYAGPYYRSVGTVSSVERSIKKMDIPTCREYLDKASWSNAVTFIDRICDDYFRTRSSRTSVEDVMATMDLTTASGQPWSRYGIKKKRDFFSNKEALSYLFDFRYPPLWKISPKTEWYHIDDLKENKVRTFIIPPVHFLFHQKIVYQSQNESLKDFFWSAYGFNPFDGGTNRMAINLNRNRWKVSYDVSGWDRLLPILDTVYRMRNRHVHDSVLKVAEYLTYHTINSSLLTPDGLVFFKPHGNNSGSGNTTPDNILAHFYIAATALFELFDGDESKLWKCVLYLYGDDNAMSIPDFEGVTPLLIEETFKRAYSWFGLRLDPIS